MMNYDTTNSDVQFLHLFLWVLSSMDSVNIAILFSGITFIVRYKEKVLFALVYFIAKICRLLVTHHNIYHQNG